ncbi:MAG: hypothetical protein K1X66_03280 [Verrucomicrobiae bacterium]|nr:hypothetical protein [Verrucomicrobiae bacterium]
MNTETLTNDAKAILDQATDQAKDWVMTKAGKAKCCLKEAADKVNRHMSKRRWIALAMVVSAGVVAGCLWRKH